MINGSDSYSPATGPTVESVIRRYRLAMYCWFVAAALGVTLLAISQFPSWAYDGGEGEKNFRIFLAAMLVVSAILTSAGVSIWALSGPKAVTVHIPDSATIANLVQAMEDTRRLVQEVNAAHEGLHPRDELRVTDPR